MGSLQQFPGDRGEVEDFAAGGGGLSAVRASLAAADEARIREEQERQENAAQYEREWEGEKGALIPDVEKMNQAARQVAEKIANERCVPDLKDLEKGTTPYQYRVAIHTSRGEGGCYSRSTGELSDGYTDVNATLLCDEEFMRLLATPGTSYPIKINQQGLETYCRKLYDAGMLRPSMFLIDENAFLSEDKNAVQIIFPLVVSYMADYINRELGDILQVSFGWGVKNDGFSGGLYQSGSYWTDVSATLQVVRR